MAKRDEFTAATKRTMAERAAYFCSSPHCVKLTMGPHSDPEKSLRTGCAAHICAAAKGGPRYDENQTSEQRKHISNGIWMCRECGEIVDTDHKAHTVGQLQTWKANHEAMIRELRTKGYSHSLALLQAGSREPTFAKKVVGALEDRRALWVSFDAEFPDRVRVSLDILRSRFVEIRGELPEGSPLDAILLALIKTILAFFIQVEQSDLTTLRCDSNDPEWINFADALASLRKSIGLQIANLAAVYELDVSEDLQYMLPKRVES